MAELILASWLDHERDRITARLLDWLRIPSVSAHSAHAADVETSATWLAAACADAGLENVEVTSAGGAPGVYADWMHAGPGAPTVLVYGHHDVQPVEPLDQWLTPPFEPIVVDGECRARGAIDDKGQVLYQLEAVRGLLASTGRLPVNLALVVEGEEEVGSPHFEDLLAPIARRLRCDAVVVSDTGMWAPDVPSTCVGMRGLVAFDVEVRTARADLHSGMFGGAVPNPAHLLASLVAGLHDDDGRVTVPGFYDRVREPTPVERASLEALPFDEEAWMRSAGVGRLEGEAGRTTLERVGYRPTAEITGLHAGYADEGIKTIVPATGRAKVTFRLVADQDPADVAHAFRSWLDRLVPAGITLDCTEVGAVAPALTPVDHPGMGALRRAIASVWGREPLYTREGGSGPEEALGRMLDAPVLFLGVGLPDDRIHAPNERMVMDQFWKGLLAAGQLWGELAEALAPAP